MVEIVNVVGSGTLQIEVDLEELASAIGKPIAEYDPEKYPGLYVRIENDGPLVTVYRTGKFIVTGADSEEQLEQWRERFEEYLSDLSVVELPIDDEFSIQNLVCVGKLDDIEGIELSTLAVALGLGESEYEPEQFPGLIYRPRNYQCVFLIFSSGKTVITGAHSLSEAENAFSMLNDQISELE